MVGSEHEREMREDRRREPERLVEQNLPGRIRNVILSPNHVRHFHQRIVDDDGEVVRGMAIGADDDGIANHVGLEPDVAAHRVGEHDVALFRHAKADGRTLAGRDARLGLLAHDATARAGVARRTPGGQRFLPLRLELRDGAEAVIGGAGVQELGGVRLIEMKPLGLPVRTPRSADIGPLVPVEAEPAQVGDDARLRLAGRSIGVRVLDAEDIGAALTAREQPVEQRGARVADVKVAGRTRSKSNAHGSAQSRGRR